VRSPASPVQLAAERRSTGGTCVSDSGFHATTVCRVLVVIRGVVNGAEGGRNGSPTRFQEAPELLRFKKRCRAAHRLATARTGLGVDRPGSKDQGRCPGPLAAPSRGDPGPARGGLGMDPRSARAWCRWRSLREPAQRPDGREARPRPAGARMCERWGQSRRPQGSAARSPVLLAFGRIALHEPSLACTSLLLLCTSLLLLCTSLLLLCKPFALLAPFMMALNASGPAKSSLGSCSALACRSSNARTSRLALTFW